jgi:hypothetical protein
MQTRSLHQQHSLPCTEHHLLSSSSPLQTNLHNLPSLYQTQPDVLPVRYRLGTSLSRTQTFDARAFLIAQMLRS